MHPPLRQLLVEHSLQATLLVRPLLKTIGGRDRDLASQLRRAMSSVSLNTAEAFGSQVGSARLRFESARGSVYEVVVALRVAVAWGYLRPEEIAGATECLDSLGARLFGLCRR